MKFSVRMLYRDALEYNAKLTAEWKFTNGYVVISHRTIDIKYTLRPRSVYI